MALFSKDSEKNPRPEGLTVVPEKSTTAHPPSPAEDRTALRPLPAAPREDRGGAYLDKGCKISGKLSFDGPARIDGQVDGEIHAKESITIGESAVLTAQIRAASVVVAGKLSGDIVATQRIEIRPMAKVLGNLTSPVLVIHEGALFEGHCAMQIESARDNKVAVFPKEERLAQAGGQKQG